jgi:predicted RNA-binding Zn-ribbon protein involved in translation (DUF1610 family)
MNALTQLLAQSDETAKTKKCPKCGEVKSLADFVKDRGRKNGAGGWCKKCFNKDTTRMRNTEKGYLKMRYYSMKGREFTEYKWSRKSKCSFTFDEFLAAWEKHKSIYGMKSAWGPGIDHLEQHLPLTMIQHGKGQIGKIGGIKGSKRMGSNLSIDRLDSNRDYTIQNLIFIRSDENTRKKDTTYEDCKIQIRLHEERFGK